MRARRASGAFASIHAFASGEADPRYVEHIERFSAALGVRAREADSLALWVKGRLAPDTQDWKIGHQDMKASIQY